jgi:hypothetical protein
MIWIGLIIYLGWDNNSPPWNFLWITMWKYIPGFNRLRVWSRIYILLLPIIALLLTRALEYFFHLLDDREAIQSSRLAILLSGGISLGILFFQISNSQPDKFARYWGWMETGNPNNYIILGSISMILFFGAIWIARRGYFSGNSKIPLALILAFFLLIDARGGQLAPWIWIQDGKTNYLEKIHSAKFLQSNNDQLPDYRVDRSIPIPLNGDFNIWAERRSWHFQRYVDFLNQTDDQDLDRQVLLGQDGGQLFFFTKELTHQDIRSFLDDHQRTNDQIVYKVIKYSGDEVILEISSSEDTFLSYIDNWDPNWKAYLDEEETEITLLFGTFKSVNLPSGDHQVRFFYQP